MKSNFSYSDRNSFPQNQQSDFNSFISFSTINPIESQPLPQGTNEKLFFFNQFLRPIDMKTFIPSEEKTWKYRSENREVSSSDYLGPKDSDNLFQKDKIMIPQEQQESKSSVDSKNIAPPWLTEKTKKTQGIMKLHYEILDFYKFMSPTEQENQVKLLTFKEFRSMIKESFNNSYSVKLFGSFPINLHLPDSDIDVVLIQEDFTQPNDQNILNQVANELVSKKLVSFIKLIEAKVTIIRAIWSSTGVQMDIWLINNLAQTGKTATWLKKSTRAYY